MTAERIAVVGIGNLLMSDDGVGVHVVQALQKKKLPGVELIDAGTAIIHTADCLRGCTRILVVDAFEGGAAPGTLYFMKGAEVLENDFRLSVHSLGLKTAFSLLTEGEPQTEWLLLGVEPGRIGVGLELSPRVASAVPVVVRAVENMVDGWLA